MLISSLIMPQIPCRSYNYICHLSTFSRELMDQAGRFSIEHDGSQDYDMILRLTEKMQNILSIFPGCCIIGVFMPAP